MSMLNVAGAQFDFAEVVYAVLEECEHRRRGLDDAALEKGLMKAAREKLAEVRRVYDEYGGSKPYWDTLEKEILDTAMPQYVQEARSANALERSNYNVWRSGDVGARFAFALAGLLIGSIIIALPFIPIFEDMFAFALTGAGFMYPDLKRYTFERRHAKELNRLITDSARYQADSRLHYMTTKDITDSFVPASVPSLPSSTDGGETNNEARSQSHSRSENLTV